MASFKWPPQGGSGSGGIVSINGSTATAQTIAGSSPLKVSSSAGTTTLSGPFTSFVYQPGGTATAPGGNVYTSFSALYTDLNKASGDREIVFDGTSATCEIPPGTYDFSNVVFSTRLPLDGVNIQDGAHFTGTGFPIINGVNLQTGSNTPVYTFTSGNLIALFDNISDVQCNGSGPLIRIDNSLGGVSFAVILLKSGASVNFGTHAAFDFVNVATAFIYAEEQATFASNTLSGDVATLLVGVIPVGSGQISLTQSAFLGTLAISLSDSALNHAYDDTSTNLVASTVQGAITSLAQRVAPININVTPVSNSSTTETNLMSVNLTSLGLAMNAAGDSVIMRAAGTLAATVSSKTIKAYYGSTAILTSGSLAVNGGSWVIDVEIVRVSNGHQIVRAKIVITSAALVTTTIVNVSDPAGGNGDVLKVTGTDSLASSGVTQSLMDTRFTPII